MLAKITSGSVIGVEGYTIEVEVDVSNGFPSFDIVGLPDSAIKESKDRVRTAIKNSNLVFPVKKITVNLAPANIKKEGPSFDLPIAVGILVCIGVIPKNKSKNIFIAGELSLDGSIRPIKGILPMVHNAKKNGIETCIVPFNNADEAGLIKNIDIIPVKNISEVIEFLNGTNKLKVHKIDFKKLYYKEDDNQLDFSDVKGQENVKRALEISSAGYHNIIMIGPPGSGKTMMAKRIPTILPSMTFEESLEVTKIYSVAELINNNNALITKRPFRSPHHTISYAALTGGGRIPQPGEISLAHNGVLFLDELPEFHKNVLEILRQPLEDKFVTISRVNGTVVYPSNFMLVGSMNPCPCGFYGDSQKCKCSQNEIARYLNKISGPLLDRIDIQVEALKVEYNDLEQSEKIESSLSIKNRILLTHKIQEERYINENIRFNSELNTSQIEKYCVLDNDGKDMIKKAFDVMGLSARAYHKILKLSRTIADLDQKQNIELMHLAEAIQYRSLDRKYWN